jgi:ABC-type multidrug transport system ATPase subunit
MELRCVSKLALELVEENVMKTLDVLHLNDVMDKPVNKLNAGERRRLSIAEEIVCGPTLLLIDEPTTNLDPLAESVLLRTFREMVNESRTVVATLHQPSAVVFDLFDTLLLLSKGQVIYHGPAADAVKYFVAQPLNFPFADYSNPADFLTDVSAGAVVDNKKSKANPFTLAKEWRKTDKYIALMKRLNPETFIAGGTGNSSKANSKAGTAKTSANNSVQPLRITEKSGSLSSPVRRLNTNGSETTDDGGDVFPNADGAMDGDSGRLTFSRSTNSYGGMQKHTIALEQAAGSNGEPLRKSDGAAMQYNQLHTGASGSLATVLSDEDDVKTLEMQRKAEYDNKALVTGSFARIWGIVCDIIGSFFFTVISGTASFFTNSEYRTILFMRMYVLLKRSAVGLWKRKQLFFGSFFVLIFIALLLGTVLGNSQESIYNTISFFAVGPLLIMLSNVQMISYLFATHQVFYKDHSRGIYSNFTYWLVSSIPLYLLRMLSAFCAAPILYAMLELEAPAGSTFADTQGYYILMTVLGTVASTMIVEFLIYIAPTIRAAYLMVPALSFGQFMFCGLFLKPQLLPAWMQQWAPSISLFRWTLQGCFLNQFEGNDTLFPPIGNMSTFDAFTSLYGWGNQNKWYCMYMVVAVIGVIRLITLLATSFVSRVRKGN